MDEFAAAPAACLQLAPEKREHSDREDRAAEEKAKECRAGAYQPPAIIQPPQNIMILPRCRLYESASQVLAPQWLFLPHSLSGSAKIPARNCSQFPFLSRPIRMKS